VGSLHAAGAAAPRRMPSIETSEVALIGEGGAEAAGSAGACCVASGLLSQEVRLIQPTPRATLASRLTDVVGPTCVHVGVDEHSLGLLVDQLARLKRYCQPLVYRRSCALKAERRKRRTTGVDSPP